MLARIDIQEYIDGASGSRHGFAELTNGQGMISGHAKCHVRKPLDELDGPAKIRPDHVIRQDDVLHTCVRQHFRLGERRTLVLHDAQIHLQAHDFSHLVGLAVGA